MVRSGVSPCADSMPGKLLNLLVSVLAASYMNGASTFPVGGDFAHFRQWTWPAAPGDCVVKLFGFIVGLQLAD